jgi:hypothetical protein
MRDGIQVILIDRSDPDQLVAFDPKRPEGERDITQLQSLRESNGFLRSDIVLVNIWHRGDVTRQPAAYASESGEPYGEALDYLGLKDLLEAWAINARIIETAAKHPEFKRYLRR